MNLCIYHRADLDGVCSAAIVLHYELRYEPHTELLGWTHGDPIPWDRIGAANKVFLVDLSFPDQDMQRLIDTVPNLVWIDHHKTAMERWAGSTIAGVRKVGQAACELCWDYFNLTAQQPLAVQWLGRWDTRAWVNDIHSERIKEFQYGMRALNPGVAHECWQQLLWSCESPVVLQTLIEHGNVVLRFARQQYAELTPFAFETTLDGHQVLALNTYKGSERFDEIWAAHPDCVAMVPFLWRGDVRKWEVSLYSDRGFDCAAIAKAHRGGGHAGAAGFQCNALPFDL